MERIPQYLKNAAVDAPWLDKALQYLERMPEQGWEVRDRAYHDLYFFAKLVNPGYAYGSIHEEIFRWMQEYKLFGMGDGIATSNKLVMMPRAHLKSHMVATWCAWIIMRHPEVTILYVSATAELAETQLFDIKNILESRQFQKYWPEYVNPDVGVRTKWTTKKIIVDHPKRLIEGVRDATIATAGLTTNTTGWHADIVAADDLVVPENAYTEDGRDSVSKKSSQFTSIRNNGGFTMACGTRYHPADIYDTWNGQRYPLFDENGQITEEVPVWEIKEYKVEEDNIFLWPRSVRPDGKAFGFDLQSLARIKAEYSDHTQFYAQYYNDPNDPGSDRISRDKFQYYNPRFLRKEGGWKYNGKKLNIFAAIDFAYSLEKAADFTAIVVIGIDHEDNIYVLDIDRFKSTKTIDYFNHVARLHSKWGFRRLQAEVTAAQVTIVHSIKDYLKKNGMTLPITEYRPTRKEGSKEQRIAAVLEHRYEDYKMWHFEGGDTMILEDELVKARPKHDDTKDALASAVSIAVAPIQSMKSKLNDFMSGSKNKNRFGGF